MSRKRFRFKRVFYNTVINTIIHFTDSSRNVSFNFPNFDTDAMLVLRLSRDVNRREEEILSPIEGKVRMKFENETTDNTLSTFRISSSNLEGNTHQLHDWLFLVSFEQSSILSRTTCVYRC